MKEEEVKSYSLKFTKTKIYFQINRFKSVVPDGVGHMDIQVSLVSKSQELTDLLKHGHLDIHCQRRSLLSVEALEKSRLECIRQYDVLAIRQICVEK